MDSIYDALNIKGETVRDVLVEKSEKNKTTDLFKLNDSGFNEVLRGLYSRIGDDLVEKTDAVGCVAKNLGLISKSESEEDERF